MSYYTRRRCSIYIVTLCLIFISICATAQKETNNWYFGWNQALSFNNGFPILETGSSMSQLEGSSSISDNKGNLLFYTNGVTVWNNKHQIVLNGTDLMGNMSSTQSALIVPQPDNDSIYYIFTVAPEGQGGLNYSILNRFRGGGKGEITLKNISLVPFTTEKLAGIRNCNKKDVWVVTTELNTNNFYAFNITKNGICGPPVISSVGEIQNENQYPGYLKFSPDGSKLVLVGRELNTSIFNFDDLTGKITLFRTISRTITKNGISYIRDYYGASFSPDNTKLYFSSGWWTQDTTCSRLVQYDLNTANLDTSETLIFSNKTGAVCPSGGLGAIQQGPDGRLYVVNYMYNYIHIIEKPNNTGLACNFIEKGIYLNQSWSALGLPNFIESYFDTSPPKLCAKISIIPDFTYQNFCSNQEVLFKNLSSANTGGVCCYQWNFGDLGSSANFSFFENPSHTYQFPGTYQVTLTVKSTITCETKTIMKQITIASTPRVFLGNDTTLCRNDTLKLNAFISNATYNWQDHSGAPTFEITKPGKYWVNVLVNTCSTSDTIIIAYNANSIKLGNDTSLCMGTSIVLDATVTIPLTTYVWKDGSTTPTFNVFQQGTYWVTATADNCKISDTILINFKQLPIIHLGEDTTLCEGQFLKLNAGTNTNYAYKWQDNSTAAFYNVAGPGKYWVIVTTNNCSKTDSILIRYQTIPKVNLGTDTNLCPGQKLLLNATTLNASYLWQDHSKTNMMIADKKGIYWVSITVNQCIGSDTIIIGQKDCDVMLYLPNTFTPNADGLNDLFMSAGNGIVVMTTHIFNRWGNEIFKTEKLSIEWDGLINGKEAPNDIYYWVVEYMDIEGRKNIKSGHVLLLR